MVGCDWPALRTGMDQFPDMEVSDNYSGDLPGYVAGFRP